MQRDASFSSTRCLKTIANCIRLFVDYRYFDAANITPRFEFGFGLGYTMFEYSLLSTDVVDNGDNPNAELENNWLAGKPGAQVVGASTAPWLHHLVFNVTFRVRNFGDFDRTEVHRLFLVYLRNTTSADQKNKNRYHNCTCTSATGRVSHHRSCAGSPTWICCQAR